MRVRRVFVRETGDEAPGYVHYDGDSSDYTLCGQEQNGDSDLQLEPGVTTRCNVDCPRCIALVRAALTRVAIHKEPVNEVLADFGYVPETEKSSG